jgi:DMSO/TMAO reductase YedYZ heme-binding membrane subunit
MNTFTVPVAMLVNKGGLAVGVIALLIMLALASKSDPTVRNQRI